MKIQHDEIAAFFHFPQTSYHHDEHPVFPGTAQVFEKLAAGPAFQYFTGIGHKSRIEPAVPTQAFWSMEK
ncbi:MAG: hypothetical protein H6573_33255 [Lewinellaceae bacterium]|nr:hypothetical protein [Lewinellaceae bacterium]